jgi:hypothetical protein
MWRLPMSGVGDVLAAVFKAVGIEAFAKYLASRRNKSCRCPARQKMLNIRFFGLWEWLWDWGYIWWCPCNQPR